jgi:hypothetical protein
MPYAPLPCPLSRVCVGAHGKALALALGSPLPENALGQQILPRTNEIRQHSHWHSRTHAAGWKACHQPSGTNGLPRARGSVRQLAGSSEGAVNRTGTSS